MDAMKELKKSVKKKDAFKDYKQVNKCIDKLLEGKNTDDSIKEIKSMICHIEGRLNKSNAYSIIAIAYALFISIIAILSDTFFNGDKIMNMVIIIIIFCMTIFICLISSGVMKDDYKYIFILKALNFKLEEKGYLLESNSKNVNNSQDKLDKSREFIVKVSEK
jgi:hypothetical protein